MGNLASGVNKMAELQVKRLKLQEESEKERRKERENFKLAKMYMQILGMPQNSFVQQLLINFG